MPTLIVKDASNSLNGEMSQKDLETSIKNFKDFALIESSSPKKFQKSKKIKKTTGLNIPFWIFKKLIEDSDKKDGIDSKYVNIHFAISGPDQISCVDEETDISNSLTAVISIGKKDKSGNMIERMKIGDQVITSGFKPQPKEILFIEKQQKKLKPVAVKKVKPAAGTLMAAAAAAPPPTTAIDNCCGHPR